MNWEGPQMRASDDDFKPSGNYNVDVRRRRLRELSTIIKNAIIALLDAKREKRRVKRELSELGKKGAETKKRRKQQEDLFD